MAARVLACFVKALEYSGGAGPEDVSSCVDGSEA